MNSTATLLQPAEQHDDERPTAIAVFRLNTALPAGIVWGDQQDGDGECAALLREVSARGCRIETQKALDIGTALAVRVGVNYLDYCIVRDVELAPRAFIAELQILPTRNGVALLEGLQRLVTATAARVSGRL